MCVGYYEFTKLQFGLSAAPRIFQEAMSRLLTGIQRVAVYQDDILVGGKTKEEHNETHRQVLERLDIVALKVNFKKLQTGCK